MARASRSSVTATRWTSRIVPVLLLGLAGYAIYTAVDHLCVDFLIRQRHQTGLAAALIALFFIFGIPALASYIRIVYTVNTDPGLVPLVSTTETSEKKQQQQRRGRIGPRRGQGRGRDVEEQPWVSPDLSPDSPGLENFYSKDAFLCEVDGRPKWCSECRQWKPDRAHHSTDLGRCVRKMDHLCPWVGGMVSETSFNFFVQFTVSATAWCALWVAIGGYCLHEQVADGQSLDGRTLALIVLGGFFTIFAIGMASTSLQFMMQNRTTVDMFRKNHSQYVAVYLPPNTPPSTEYETITYPLSIPPLQPDCHPPNTDEQSPQQPHSARDLRAMRTFAILRSEPTENVFELGAWGNFKSIMGNNIFEWIFPIRHSPCCNHDSMKSDYEFGEALNDMKRRYGIPGVQPKENGDIEMQEHGANSQ